MNYFWKPSDNKYPTFDAYSMDSTWRDVGGLYIFSYVDMYRANNFLYIGKATSFKQRFSRHERWDEACAKGATHVLVAVVQNEFTRSSLEEMLIQEFSPPMNDQYNKPLVGGMLSAPSQKNALRGLLGGGMLSEPASKNALCDLLGYGMLNQPVPQADS
jgi:GIY-YIG catalytic domain